MTLTRIYVVRESKAHSVLDVFTGADFSSGMGIDEYIESYLAPADDGLSIEVAGARERSVASLPSASSSVSNSEK